jgi:hypothetical protein
MTSRLPFILLLCVVTVCGEVKTKKYTDPEGCVGTYRIATGRVLTPRGLVEDPTVNAIMKEAVSAQMNPLKISEAGKSADLEIRFMGGNSAGLQVDDLAVGDMAMWDIGGPQPISGRTYKKSNLVIAAVDNRSNRTIWAARCTDKFGDPNHLQERVQKAVAKAFAKFPKKLACST